MFIMLRMDIVRPSWEAVEQTNQLYRDHVYLCRGICRRVQDFCEGLPLVEMTHPSSAPLNLAASMPAGMLRPDLGPKSYIAYGRCVSFPSSMRL